MEQRELREIERRPLEYWNVDGLPELLMGSMWLLWGGLWLIGSALPWGVASTCFWLVVPPALACSGLFGARAIQRLKQRITYPRTGYVRMKEPADWVRAVVALVALFAAGAVVFGLVKDNEMVLAPLVVAVLAVWLLVAAIHTRSGHLVILALASAGLGAWMWRAHAGWAGLNWTFLWLGVVSLVLGSLRLRRFLRDNPKPAETEA